MPIFMDRHELVGASASDVADAHRKDLEIQDSYGVKFLTYWFDGQRGTTFCLVDAPDKNAVHCVHRDAHGLVPSEIIEVPISAVEAFLGRVYDAEASPAPSKSDLGSALRAIMFTDIVGSTSMTERLGDRLATELVRAHDSVVHRCLSKFGGREVKHTGDGIMASFTSVSKAVECAIDVQHGFQLYNAGNPEPINVRIGLDCGEPVEDSNDLFGSSVQMAARLCDASSGGEILVSEGVLREFSDAELFVATKPLHLKGFSKPIQAFKCAPTTGAR
ncbi:DUF4242 domain-containing protein [Mesorhizobium sp. CGMCC 1.15528]|uniref:DUF4242 domain-containing protein n=1 Tax=Mesorhizobium zhangyense TaxID=1776730 RepID=A0A7C9REI9_9HYPH|nr:nickel-binding protein [Mesorhizobium zhangyense]NGN44713.1 DUF4242 domain-containing protein [Mesorhizobium zhangyense]